MFVQKEKWRFKLITFTSLSIILINWTTSLRLIIRFSVHDNGDDEDKDIFNLMVDGVLDMQLINRIFGLELIILVFQISRPQLRAIKGVGPNILLLSDFFYFVFGNKYIIFKY